MFKDKLQDKDRLLKSSIVYLMGINNQLMTLIDNLDTVIEMFIDFDKYDDEEEEELEDREDV